MASSLNSVHKSSDLVKDYSCEACESKNIETSADSFCETCWKFFCKTCLYHHDQIFVNHVTYGRKETNKWPLAKIIEDLLLKCDIHNNEKLKMFCHDHSKLCCSDCVLFNHRQCTNLALIPESVKKLSVDMQQLSIKIKTILAALDKFNKTQESNMQSLEGSYNELLKEIREQREKLITALDVLENTTLKEMDEIRTTLLISLKKDVDNCSTLKKELQQLDEAVQGLHDKSNKEMEFIANIKCLDKIHASESYLKENPVKVQSSIIFKSNIQIEQYLSTQASLWGIIDCMQSLTQEMNPDQVLTVESKSKYKVKISKDIGWNYIKGICSLPSGQVIVADYDNERVKILNKRYKVSRHCDVPGSPRDICQITSSEVAVALGDGGVQFMYLTKRKLMNDRKIQFSHDVIGIAHHQGALYITSRTALYHYTLHGTLVKKLYEDKVGGKTVYKCAVSPAGDRIYVTNYDHNKLITLATDGTLISTFTDPELRKPQGVHVTPSGQVIVCGSSSQTVIQVDCGGRKKMATLASEEDGLTAPLSVCYNTVTDQIIVGVNDIILVMDLQ